MNVVHQKVQKILKEVGIEGIELSVPPKPEMGDIAVPCFALAKQEGKNPAEVAKDVAEKVSSLQSPAFASVSAAGPYVNLSLDGGHVAQLVMGAIQDGYGSHAIGKGKKIMVEYGCPNPLKAFHIGHLKNLVTGEAVVRTLENAGYKVIRVNYQGDVGMHVAKALWGIFDWKDKFDALDGKPLKDRVEFLGKAYAHGATAFEEHEDKKQEVIAYNDKVYEHAEDIQDVYQKARGWSLEYFDQIYTRLGSRFDRLYFESEVYEPGVAIVKEFLKKNVFKESEGAVIFEGSKHGLHDRVFINSKGFPTYEAKDLALSDMHFDDYNPDGVIHVVGKEQKQYFEVVFKALEEIRPHTKGKEYHLPGGFLQLKGDKKMSSRKGNIVTGDALIDMVKKRIREAMKEQELDDSDLVAERVTVAALKYAMLKADVTKDIAFDLEESISTSGDSGPYLLYIVARIKGILGKAELNNRELVIPDNVQDEEKALLLMLSAYPSATEIAVKENDPSYIARYLFSLAQSFNSFYAACPVLQAEENVQAFRVQLIERVLHVMEHGLHILGIETVEKM